VERLRADGFVIHRGAIETIELAAGSYDVVVLSETVEHVLDPRRAVASCCHALRPGGVLYITTPNVDSLSRHLLGNRWRALCYPDHLYCFNTRSIRALLESSGLKPVHIRTEGINPFEIAQHLRSGRAAQSDALGQRTEALRTAAATTTAVVILKRAVNFVLGTLALGDTIKVLAEKPC
jgi:SAM-dependent methyltransferase